MSAARFVITVINTRHMEGYHIEGHCMLIVDASIYHTASSLRILIAATVVIHKPLHLLAMSHHIIALYWWRGHT